MRILDTYGAGIKRIVTSASSCHVKERFLSWKEESD